MFQSRSREVRDEFLNHFFPLVSFTSNFPSTLILNYRQSLIDLNIFSLQPPTLQLCPKKFDGPPTLSSHPSGPIQLCIIIDCKNIMAPRPLLLVLMETSDKDCLVWLRVRPFNFEFQGGYWGQWIHRRNTSHPLKSIDRSEPPQKYIYCSFTNGDNSSSLFSNGLNAGLSLHSIDLECVSPFSCQASLGGYLQRHFNA